MDIESNKTEFNMANSTLQRLDGILKAINDISIRTELLPNNQNFLKKGRGQHMKLKLARDLFVQSVALLSPEDVEPLKIKVQGFKPCYKIVELWNCGNKEKAKVSDYNAELEESLDDFIIELQIKLQKKGFFMPSQNKEELK